MVIKKQGCIMSFIFGISHSRVPLDCWKDERMCHLCFCYLTDSPDTIKKKDSIILKKSRFFFFLACLQQPCIIVVTLAFIVLQQAALLLNPLVKDLPSSQWLTAMSDRWMFEDDYWKRLLFERFILFDIGLLCAESIELRIKCHIWCWGAHLIAASGSMFFLY